MRPVNGLYFFGLESERPADTEWEEAMAKDEKLCYYREHWHFGGIKIRCYKPSVAAIIAKRTGKTFELIG